MTSSPSAAPKPAYSNKPTWYPRLHKYSNSTLPIPKFRAYEFPYHRTHAKQPATVPITLRVNNVDIPLRQSGTLTYLGSQYDLDPNGQSQYDHHQTQLDRHLHAIRHRPAPVNSKIYVLQHALIPRLTYTSQFIPLNPQQMEAMDKKILKWSRQILRLTPTFPAAVMSSPPTPQNSNAQRRDLNFPTPLLLA